MKLSKIGNDISKSLGKTGLKIKKASPTILVILGIGGVVVSTVMACKASRKLDDVLEEANDTIEEIKEAPIAEEAPEDADENTLIFASESARKGALAKAYAHTGIELIKLYGPSVALGVASVGCILGSHHIMRVRNAGLAAAYKAIDESYKKYRKNVIDDQGAEKDLEYRHGIKKEKHKVKVQDEDGKISTKTEEYDVSNLDAPSDYARYFMPGKTVMWENDMGKNYFYISSQERYYNDMLQSRGHVFLNEVYDALGLERTPEGQVVGWVKGEGDDYIDFGMLSVHNRNDFHSGKPSAILLDFNVDGVIVDKI